VFELGGPDFGDTCNIEVLEAMAHDLDGEQDFRERFADGGLQEALGQSEAFLTFQEQLSRVARVDRPILIIGERGSGKELAAARLHFLSKRWQEPFVALNCAALAPSLIESELFGHEAGAFTGATGQRKGRFEAANGGTLLLDEIGTIPVETQEKILRVVEYGAFERVGSSRPVRVDVRIIGATNANLPEMAGEGAFMQDLLDRLSFEVLFVPPLRARKEDIVFLANHFGSRMAFELGWEKSPEITEEAAQKLEGYPWPGNVRELKNVVERAVYRSDDALITAEEIVFDPFQSPFERLPTQDMDRAELEVPVERTGPREPRATEDSMPDKPLAEVVSDLEIRMIRQALERTKYNQREAAEILGLTYHQFRGLYRKYGGHFD